MGGARELAWAVTRVGRSEGESRDDFTKLVGEVEREWQALFPRRLGYAIEAERDGSEVRLTVSRGDFVGKLELCCARERAQDVGGSMIRLVASADSRELLAARAAGRRAIGWASGLATGVGALASLGLCWLAVSVELAPLGVGLMMLAVIIGMALIGGHLLGVRLGEDLARHFELRAERRRADDLGLRADLERWKCLGRRLRGHRRALARGLVGTPFRRG